MNTAYRVWDGEQMHYWDDEKELSLEIGKDEWILWRNDPDGCRVALAKSFDGESVLMWHIGSLDKHNNAIYEYDIDMIDDEPMIVVRVGEKLGLKIPGDFNYHIEDCIDWEECDIGGNVYQNPELLEGAE